MMDQLYVCKDCGHVFTRPKVLYGHGDWPRDDDSPNEYVCPECDSDDYRYAEQCAECGEVFCEDDLEYGLCKDCLNEAAQEHAAEYVMNDPGVRDGFAWWMQGRRKRGL